MKEEEVKKLDETLRSLRDLLVVRGRVEPKEQKEPLEVKKESKEPPAQGIPVLSPRRVILDLLHGLALNVTEGDGIAAACLSEEDKGRFMEEINRVVESFQKTLAQEISSERFKQEATRFVLHGVAAHKDCAYRKSS